MFGPSRKRLIWLCGSMATMLDAGLPVSRALEVVGRQAPRGRLRRTLLGARNRIEGGENLSDALAAGGHLPRLLLNLVAIGEQTGTLELTLREAERFYELQRRLWNAFLSRIILPGLQYVIAVAIIAFAFYVRAMLDQPLGNPFTVLWYGYGVPAVIVGAYVLFGGAVGAARLTHEVVLRVPVLGGVARSLALARFSLLMHLMMEAGAPVVPMLEEAFDGTGNHAFRARTDSATDVVRQGGTLTGALASAGLFPRDYLDLVEVAEESGTLSERFNWLARHHTERTEFALAALARLAAIAVWVVVASVIIYFIVTIFMSYINTLQNAASGRL